MAYKKLQRCAKCNLIHTKNVCPQLTGILLLKWIKWHFKVGKCIWKNGVKYEK